MPITLQGRTYLCKKLDLASKVAVVRPADLKYYTKTRDFCDVDVTGGHAAYQQQASLDFISAELRLGQAPTSRRLAEHFGWAALSQGR